MERVSVEMGHFENRKCLISSLNSCVRNFLAARAREDTVKLDIDARRNAALLQSIAEVGILLL
jgi:hypothetical protein